MKQPIWETIAAYALGAAIAMALVVLGLVVFGLW